MCAAWLVLRYRLIEALFVCLWLGRRTIKRVVVCIAAIGLLIAAIDIRGDAVRAAAYKEQRAAEKVRRDAAIQAGREALTPTCTAAVARAAVTLADGVYIRTAEDALENLASEMAGEQLIWHQDQIMLDVLTDALVEICADNTWSVYFAAQQVRADLHASGVDAAKATLAGDAEFAKSRQRQ